MADIELMDIFRNFSFSIITLKILLFYQYICFIFALKFIKIFDCHLFLNIKFNLTLNLS